METLRNPGRLVTTAILLTLFVMANALGGCARYARNVDTLYVPVAAAKSGVGEVYVIVPENRQTDKSDIKWVIGTVRDDKQNKIDEIFSSRSPAEIIQAALRLELNRAGYDVITSTKRPDNPAARIIDLTKTEIGLEQISDFADLKATCIVTLAIEVFQNGVKLKGFQYESVLSRTEIKDRDLLAQAVLQDSLQSIMKNAVPDLTELLQK